MELVGPEQDKFETFNLGRAGKGTSTGQDPGVMKERAKLYAHIALIPVSNGAGLGTSPSICRKNASWRDSTMSIDDIDFINRGSVTASRSVRSIAAPIPIEVMSSATSRNWVVELTGKE